jgi:ribosome-interacting GTPase 1
MPARKRISVTEATQLGVSGLISAAQKDQVVHIERHGKNYGAVISAHYLQELESLREDLLDTLLIITRMATDDGSRTSLDQLIAEAGFTRKELADDVEEELRQAGLRK